LSKSRAFWQQFGPYLAFGTALTATLGSLYYSEIAHYIPCALCWYQRIFMYPLVLITLVGIIRQDDYLPDYVLPLSVVGLAISIYHNLIQYGVIAESGACQVGVPCDALWVNYLGFITIPLMSLTAFIIITVVMALTKWANLAGTE
jgi:disulfide bond formation protein DsbB